MEQLNFLPEIPEVPRDRYPAAFLNPQRDLPKLRLLEIEAFKGIEHLQIEFQPLTILTGPNNSGKSTILQAILLGFECFRRCLDTPAWQLSSSGRAVSEFDFLPVNEPKDMWFNRVWKPSREREQYVRVGFTFDNDVQFVARLRFLFGMLNVGLESFRPDNPPSELLQALAKTSPILIPATPGPQSHEPIVALAQLHRLLGTGEPSRVVRNILLHLQSMDDQEPWEFVVDVISRYFHFDLSKINFDERRDLEIRAPYTSEDFSLDIVSAGSGLNQILQLAAIIAWRRPGIVLLDEPDSHLHTSLQIKLLDFIYDLSARYGLQIIVSTHSRDLISQAPLDTIIPVDLTRERLEPLQSVEHLLLEFERQGTVSNVDLALLYQTKKCLFVEGATDARLLSKVAERLGFAGFQGRHQIVPFEFKGVDNLRMIPKAVNLFETMIGAKLSWAVVRDRDANIPSVINRYREEASNIGIPELHIWSCYSIENNFLDVRLITEAIKERSPRSEVSIEQVRKILEEVVREVEKGARGVFITKTQVAYRKFEMAQDPFDIGAQDAINFLMSLTTLEEKLQFYPGKKIFGKFVERLQKEHTLTLRLDDLVAQITETNASEDLITFVEMVERL